jgi:hypothetical protein
VVIKVDDLELFSSDAIPAKVPGNYK